MKINPFIIDRPASHAELAERLAAIRQAERAGGFQPGHGLPCTTEAVIRAWEKEQGHGR